MAFRSNVFGGSATGGWAPAGDVEVNRNTRSTVRDEASSNTTSAVYLRLFISSYPGFVARREPSCRALMNLSTAIRPSRQQVIGTQGGLFSIVSPAKGPLHWTEETSEGEGCAGDVPMTSKGFLHLAGMGLLLLAPPTGLWAAETEQLAAEYFRTIGGTVTRDDRARGQPVLALDLTETRLTYKDLDHLAGLHGLRELRLGYNYALFNGLRPLAGLKELRVLDLNFTGAAPAGLKDLAGLKQLRDLDLQNTAATDE